MKTERIIEILRQHNKWRRGKTDETPFTIRELGEAIDEAVKILEGVNSCKKPAVSVSVCPRCGSNKIAESDENKDWMDCEWCSLRWEK